MISKKSQLPAPKNSKRSKLLFLLLFFCLGLSISYGKYRKAIWVWDTSDILASQSQQNIILNQLQRDSISDVFLYAHSIARGNNWSEARQLIQNFHCLNIRVWALDGYRAYFSDWNGPQKYYEFIQGIIDYNSQSAQSERFDGIHGDNEPQDGQGQPLATFHNGIADSKLSSTDGGVWQASARDDREMLMRDWLEITEQSQNLAHQNQLLYGQAMPSWLDQYYGEPISCTYKAKRATIVQHMANYLDDYVIMSYNTNVENVINRVKDELNYISSLSDADGKSLSDSSIQVLISGETHCGVGENISYCDTPEKNTKAIFAQDFARLTDSLKQYQAFGGFAIHDWQGWKGLSPQINDSLATNYCASSSILQSKTSKEFQTEYLPMNPKIQHVLQYFQGEIDSKGRQKSY